MNQNDNNKYGRNRPYGKNRPSGNSASRSGNRSAYQLRGIWRGIVLFGVIVAFLIAGWNRTQQDQKSPANTTPGTQNSTTQRDYSTASTENTNSFDSDPRLANAREIASRYLDRHKNVTIKGPSGEAINLTPLLKRIAEGKSDSHRNDGSEFYNRERKLPQRDGRYYTEFVDRDSGDRSPGAKRLIIGQAGDIWYTLDHYQSFVKVGE